MWLWVFSVRSGHYCVQNKVRFLAFFKPNKNFNLSEEFITICGLIRLFSVFFLLFQHFLFTFSCSCLFFFSVTLCSRLQLKCFDIAPCWRAAQSTLSNLGKINWLSKCTITWPRTDDVPHVCTGNSTPNRLMLCDSTQQGLVMGELKHTERCLLLLDEW